MGTGKAARHDDFLSDSSGFDEIGPCGNKGGMAKLVDPTKLISLQEAAAKYGYSAEHMRRLVTSGRIEGWRIGGNWTTLAENVQHYKKTHPPVGRPRQKK